ncbi:uncharacterized protein L201_002981 [Kwoniella dendrophila CBS 6074]|uniref:Myb-like domain-containing protein n=1 Tax=Kwoniella dendrophila CBS 6074 TaxID=1295534 RepID=A0AAX4JU51_9TREE
MAYTRASATAGPSRLPYNPPDGSSWNITVDDEGHLASPNLSSKVSDRRNRSVSFQPPDYASTPNTSRHRRKHSGGSHYSVHLTPPLRTNKQKAVIRKSLTGENVLGMNINNRAEILADVAGDCLVTLVKSALSPDTNKRRRSSVNDEVKQAWDGFFGIRQSYFFPPHSPPFPSYDDTLHSLHLNIQNTLNAQILARAVALSNLATFVWIISRPDEAGISFPNLDIDEENDIQLRRRSTRNKGKDNTDQNDLELMRRVKKRNSLLLTAWKRFWLVVVPEQRKTSEIALRLWLDFATQIALLYQEPFIHSLDLIDIALPEPPRTLLAELFSPSAVGRFSYWSILEDFDEPGYDKEKASVEERWESLVRRRTEELASISLENLQRKYPYEKFKTELIAYVQHEVLASPIDTLLTPSRRQLLIASAQDAESRQSQLGESDVSEAEGDDTEIADWSESSTSISEDAAERTIVRDNLLDRNPQNDDQEDDDKEEDADGEPIDMDILALAAAEFGIEENDQVPQKYQVDILNEVPDENVEESTNFEEEVVEPTSAQRSADDDEEGWTVKDAAPSSFVSHSSGQILSGKPSTVPKFDWTKRQDDAVRVEWESQSIDEDEDEDEDEDNDNNINLKYNDNDKPQPHLTSQPNQYTPSVSATVAARLIEITPRSSPPPLRISRPFTASSQISTPIPKPLFTQPQIKPNTLVFNSSSVTEESEEEEAIENVVDGSGEFSDLLPSDSQFDPVGIIARKQQDVVPDIHFEYDEFANLLPSESQFAAGRSINMNTSDQSEAQTDLNDPDADLNDLDSDSDNDDYEHQLGHTTSQGQYLSSRPRKSHEARSFIPPNPNEDIEDRQLLIHPPSPPGSYLRSGSEGPITVEVKREPAEEPQYINEVESDPPLQTVQDALGLHAFVSRSHPSRLDNRRQRGSQVPLIREEDDPFLHDEDGSPLEPNELWVLPYDVDVKPFESQSQSRLFGKTHNSQSHYCRLTGKRKWTLSEELLLYRSVQKIPLEEEYPLRMVYYLFGEFGKLSKDLKWYNTQHMKDKLRTTIRRRQNQNLIVNGRVRAWAARGTKEREDYENEMKEYKQWRDEQAALEEDEEEEQDDGDNEGDDVDMEGHQEEVDLNERDIDSHEADDDAEIDEEHVAANNSIASNSQDDEAALGDDDDFPDPDSLPLPVASNNSIDVEDDQNGGDFPSLEDIDPIQPEIHLTDASQEDFPNASDLLPTSPLVPTLDDPSMAPISTVPNGQSRSERYAARSNKRTSSEVNDENDQPYAARDPGRKRPRLPSSQPIVEIPLKSKSSRIQAVKNPKTKIPTKAPKTRARGPNNKSKAIRKIAAPVPVIRAARKMASNSTYTTSQLVNHSRSESEDEKSDDDDDVDDDDDEDYETQQPHRARKSANNNVIVKEVSDEEDDDNEEEEEDEDEGEGEAEEGDEGEEEDQFEGEEEISDIDMNEYDNDTDQQDTTNDPSVLQENESNDILPNNQPVQNAEIQDEMREEAATPIMKNSVETSLEQEARRKYIADKVKGKHRNKNSTSRSAVH